MDHWLAQSGWLYSAAPSVWIWQTVTFFKPAFLPCSAKAGTRTLGVAAAPWTNTVSPAKKNKRLKNKN